MGRRLAWSLAVATGCGANSPHSPDAACGPGSAAVDGLVASASDFSLTYSNLSAMHVDACPNASTSSDGHSIAIMGTQLNGPGHVVFCVPRADEIDHTGSTLGVWMSVDDVTGSYGGCSLTLDRSTPPTGIMNATGVCDAGTSPAGFRLAIDGRVSLLRSCNGTSDAVIATLAGPVAVAGP